MGQYYKPVFTNDEGKIIAFAHPHHVDTGLKLMEHSYVGNSVCNSVVNYLKKHPEGLRLTWAGDYADATEKVKLDKDSDFAKEVWKKAVADGQTELGYEAFYALDDEELFVDDPQAKNLYEIASENEDKEIAYETEDPTDARYIINETKKEFVDMWDIISLDAWTIHPLPLLTADGNGRGGGDYHGTDLAYVGQWAGDVIRIADNLPIESTYARIRPIFVEKNSILSALRNIEVAIKHVNYNDISEDFEKRVKEKLNEIKEAVSK